MSECDMKENFEAEVGERANWWTNSLLGIAEWPGTRIKFVEFTIVIVHEMRQSVSYEEDDDRGFVISSIAAFESDMISISGQREAFRFCV